MFVIEVFKEIVNMTSLQCCYSQFCLICINKCPMSGVRYPWSVIKEYYDGTMEHFRTISNVVTFVNNRRVYLRKSYFRGEFSRKGFWKEDAYYSSWRVRYNGPYKKFKLKKCS